MPHIDLLELPYFEGISMDALVALVDLMSPARFETGDVIVREGHAPTPLYIATSGRVLVTKQGPKDDERALAELDSPTLFGEIELFCQLPAVATTRALEPVDVFTLSRPTFERLFEARHPALLQFTANVARVACHRLAVADEMIAQLVDANDLINVRHAIFAKMREQSSLSTTTGVFERPKLENK